MKIFLAWMVVSTLVPGVPHRSHPGGRGGRGSTLVCGASAAVVATTTTTGSTNPGTSSKSKVQVSSGRPIGCPTGEAMIDSYGGASIVDDEQSPVTTTTSVGQADDGPPTTRALYDLELYESFVVAASVAFFWVAHPFFLGLGPNDEGLAVIPRLEAFVLLEGALGASIAAPNEYVFPFLIQAIGFGYALAAFTFPKLRSEDRKKVMVACGAIVGWFGAVVALASPRDAKFAICLVMVVNAFLAKIYYDWMYNQLGWRLLVLLAANCFCWLAVLLFVLRVVSPTAGLVVASVINVLAHLSVVALLFRSLMFCAFTPFGVSPVLPAWAKNWINDRFAHAIGFHLPDHHDGPPGVAPRPQPMPFDPPRRALPDNAANVPPTNGEHLVSATHVVAAAGGRSPSSAGGPGQPLGAPSPSCCICLDAIVERDDPRGFIRTSCDHVFHRGCLLQWMAQRMECPTCRRPFPPVQV